MHYRVYVDSFFIQEFAINFYVLLLCKICFISTAKYKKIALVALLLATYQTMLLFVNFPQHIVLFYGLLWFFNVVGAYLGVRMCFGKNRTIVYIKRILIYMIFLLLIGGIMLGLLPRFEIFRKSSVKVLFFLIFGALCICFFFSIYDKFVYTISI